MPDGAPAQWRNVITTEVLSAGRALPVGDVLLNFPVALLMGEGKEELCANHLSGTAPTVFPGHRHPRRGDRQVVEAEEDSGLCLIFT